MAKAAPRNVASFKAQHNRNVVIPNKIRAALEKMAKDNGPEHYEYETDFVKLAEIGASDLAAHRDAFTKFIVEAKPIGKGTSRSPRRVWFATEKAAKAAAGE